MNRVHLNIAMHITAAILIITSFFYKNDLCAIWLQVTIFASFIFFIIDCFVAGDVYHVAPQALEEYLPENNRFPLIGDWRYTYAITFVGLVSIDWLMWSLVWVSVFFMDICLRYYAVKALRPEIHKKSLKELFND